MPTRTTSPTRRSRQALRFKRSTAPARARRSPLRAEAPLPDWADLGRGRRNGKAAPPLQTRLEAVSTLRFAVIVLVLAAACTLYVGHVQATQDLLARVQAERRDNLRLHLKYNRLKGEFDRATSPAVIYERARALGLQEGYAFGPAIEVRP